MLAHAASRSVTGVRLGDWCVDATLGCASRLVEDVDHAIARGDGVRVQAWSFLFHSW